MGATASRPRPSLLLSAGMSPLVRSMHIAVMKNDVSRLADILQLGANVNQPWSNPLQPSAKDGYTALNEAVSLNHVEAARCLVQMGASVTALDSQGWTTLMRAAYHGRHRIAEIIITTGGNVNSKDPKGDTALHICCHNGFVHNNVYCIVVLLKAGSQVNLANKRGMTPLHLAASRGTDQIVSVLLAWRSDRDAIDNEFLTPVSHCMAPVTERARASPPALLRALFKRQLPILKQLLKADCDSLGLSTWIWCHWRILRECLETDEELSAWQSKNRPESLRHLCRVRIQNFMWFTPIRHKFCLRKIKKLDIPASLKLYLSRRLLSV